jgi:hypothetical protein
MNVASITVMAMIQGLTPRCQETSWMSGLAGVVGLLGGIEPPRHGDTEKEHQESCQKSGDRFVIPVDKEGAEGAESAEIPDWRFSLHLRVSAVTVALDGI